MNKLKEALSGIYERKHWLRNLALRLGAAPSITHIEGLKSSRSVEYTWIYMNIPHNKNQTRMLDVGSVGSHLPITLGQMGYKVWCIDVRKYEYTELLSNVRCIVGDIRKTNFDTGFFDIVTVVSTIEHIGLGRYGDSVDMNGDKLAMREIRRILSTDGCSLITLPFGKKMTYASHRVYDKESLRALFKGFAVEREDYYSRKVSTGFWCPCTAEDLTIVTSPKYENGLACVKVKKKQ